MKLNALFVMLLVLACFSCEQEAQPNDQKKGKNLVETETLQPNSLMQKSFAFEYGTDSVTTTMTLDSALRQRYQSAPHSYTYQGNALPANWREDYYRMFIQHPDDNTVIEALIRQLKSLHPGIGSGDGLAEMAIAFVQGSITYDWNTYHNIDKSQIRYPYETLLDGTGVCADKTILLARILDELGYQIAIFTFDKANHMALGVKVPAGHDNFRSGYAFVESTNYAPVGRIPDNYVGGLKLDRRPNVVPLNQSGKTFEKIVANQAEEKALEKKYGKEYFFLSTAQKQLKVQMADLQVELDALKKQMRGCKGTLPQAKFEACNKLQKEHNEKVERFNDLVARFNSLNQDSQTPA